MTTYLNKNQDERRCALANAKGVYLNQVTAFNPPYFSVDDSMIESKVDGMYIVAMIYELKDLINDTLQREFYDNIETEPELYADHLGDDNSETFHNWSEHRQAEGIATILGPNYQNHSIELIRDGDGNYATYHIFQFDN